MYSHRLNSASATTAQQLRLSNYGSATTAQQPRLSNHGSATTAQQPRLSNHGSATKLGFSLQQLRFSNYASATKTNSRFSNYGSATKIYSRFSNQNLSNQNPPPPASTCTVSSYTSYQNPTPSGNYMHSLILHIISKSHPLWQVHAQSHLTHHIKIHPLWQLHAQSHLPRHIKIPPPLASTCTVSSYT